MIKIIIEYSLTGSERRNKTDIQRNQSWLDRIFRFRRHFSSQKYIDLGQQNSRTMHHPCSVSSSKRVYKYIHIYIYISLRKCSYTEFEVGEERERERGGRASYSRINVATKTIFELERERGSLQSDSLSRD